MAPPRASRGGGESRTSADPRVQSCVLCNGLSVSNHPARDGMLTILLAAQWSLLRPTAPRRAPLVHCCASHGGISEFLSERLNFTAAEISRAEKRCQRRRFELLRPAHAAGICDNMQSYLELDTIELKKICLTCPQILNQNFDNSIQPKLRSLRKQLQLSEPQLRALVLAWPHFFTYSSGHLITTAAAFKQRVGLSKAELQRCLRKAPQIMALSDANLEDKIACLQATGQLTRAETREVVVKAPKLLSLSSDTVSNKWAALHKFVCDFDVSDVQFKRLVLSHPAVLAHNLERSVFPKMLYLQEALDLSATDMQQVLTTSALFTVGLEMSLRPNVELWMREVGPEAFRGRSLVFLTYSFERRTAPRMAQVKALGLPPMALLTRMSLTQESWDKYLGRV